MITGLVYIVALRTWRSTPVAERRRIGASTPRAMLPSDHPPLINGAPSNTSVSVSCGSAATGGILASAKRTRGPERRAHYFGVFLSVESRPRARLCRLLVWRLGRLSMCRWRMRTYTCEIHPGLSSVLVCDMAEWRNGDVTPTRNGPLHSPGNETFFFVITYSLRPHIAHRSRCGDRSMSAMCSLGARRCSFSVRR